MSWGRAVARSRGGAERETALSLVVFYLYLAGFRLAPALPERPAYAAASTLGWAAGRLFRRRRAVVERNLARVTGQARGSAHLDAIVDEAYRSYARYWLETFRLAREDASFFLERFTCHGVERLDRALAGGRGAVIVIGHLGNWDAAGAWTAASGRDAATVAEVLKPRRLFDYFCAHRARLGMTVYPAERGVSAKLVAAANEGKLVAILGDRDLRGRGVEVSFFGAKTTFPAGPAWIALKTGAPVLVAGVYGVELAGGKRGWEAYIDGPLEPPAERGSAGVADLTREVARRMEGFVARRPEEWHVFQPYWPEDRARS